jgi:hypothetical protein
LTRNIECDHVSSHCFDHRFRKKEDVDETQFELSTHAPFKDCAGDRGPTGISEPRTEININFRADVRSDCSQHYDTSKVLCFTGDLNDTAANRALEIPCAFDSVTVHMDELPDSVKHGESDNLTQGVSNDYDHYTHLMLWLKGSIPKTRPRHLSRLVVSLLNEEVTHPVYSI